MARKRLKVEKRVRIYSISEAQTVIEMDSPAPGCESVIVKREALYEFFRSAKDAGAYIERLRKSYMQENPSLNLVNGPRGEGLILEGTVDHPWSHVFEIYHLVTSETIPFRPVWCVRVGLLISLQRLRLGIFIVQRARLS